MRDYFAKTKTDKKKISALGNYPFMEINIPQLQVYAALTRSCQQEKYNRCGFSMLLTKHKRQICLFINTPPKLLGFFKLISTQLQ